MSEIFKEKPVITEFLRTWYWVKATMGEVYLGMGDEENAKQELQETYSKAPESWIKNQQKTN